MVILFSRPASSRIYGFIRHTNNNTIFIRNIHKRLTHNPGAFISMISTHLDLKRGFHLSIILNNRKTFRNIYHNFNPKPNARREAMTTAYGIWLFTAVICCCVLSLPRRFIDWWQSESEKQFIDMYEASTHSARGRPQAKSISDKDDSDTPIDAADEKSPDTGKKRAGFRERKIIQYENRIRNYSTPDKIFRYFATKKVHNATTNQWVLFMTPDDFVRSITPGMMQPEGLGLDKATKFNPQKGDTFKSTLPDDSVFNHIGENCMISFSDYMFLLTLLSTPRRQFELAFRMFDDNGDGIVDLAEFSKVQHSVMASTAAGKRHRDHNVTGSTLSHNSTALTSYFFGADGTQKLTVGQFLAFYDRLQRDMLRMEFDRWDVAGEGVLSEKAFADSLVVYAGLSEVKRRKMMARVKKRFVRPDDLEEGEALEEGCVLSRGVTFDEYVSFYRFIGDINDVDIALTFYTVAGASIDPGTLRHVAQTVTGVGLTEHLVDVIYCMFDENNDGELSNREFVSVMKQRVLRGLEKSKDTGFTRLMSALVACGGSMVMNRLGLSTTSEAKAK